MHATDEIDTEDASSEISREAEVDLLNDVQRDAARTRAAGSYDDVEHLEQRASEAEDQTGARRHHDAY